jgi:hypothetical protein
MEWVAKIADESQAEVAAVRLLWAIGYKTEVNYLAPKLTIPGKGSFTNVSLEARPADVQRGERWKWAENPFIGKPEFQGLKIMMAFINNWDLKDDNNAVFVTNGERQYVISDLGSSFGKLSPTSAPILNRFGRSVNKPEHYAMDSFIKGLNGDGHIDFAYDGKASGLMKEIPPADSKWLGALLSKLSRKQIADAFRAAGYSRSEIDLMTRAVQHRITQLNAPHKEYEAIK